MVVEVVGTSLTGFAQPAPVGLAKDVSMGPPTTSVAKAEASKARVLDACMSLLLF